MKNNAFFMLIFKMVKIVLYDVDMWVVSEPPKYDGEIKGQQLSVSFLLPSWVLGTKFR